MRPSVIAQWCIDAAQRINEFYRDVPVLESEGELLEGRLRLVASARQVLVSGLALLSIPVPDEM
jgi:arginyl-tRNA synthetase